MADHYEYEGGPAFPYRDGTPKFLLSVNINVGNGEQKTLKIVYVATGPRLGSP